MTNDSEPTQGGMRTWVRIVLFVSLALNLLVIGLAAGMMLRGGIDRHPATTGPDAVRPYTRAFDDRQRDALRDAFRNAMQRDRNQRDRGLIISDYRTAVAALRAEPFDPDGFRAILSEQARRAEQRREIGQAVLSDFLADMSRDERLAYAARLEAAIERFRERRPRITEE